MDKSESNAGVRLSGSKAAPSAVDVHLKEECRLLLRDALLRVRAAYLYAPSADVEKAVDAADDEVCKALHRLGQG